MQANTATARALTWRRGYTIATLCLGLVFFLGRELGQLLSWGLYRLDLAGNSLIWLDFIYFYPLALLFSHPTWYLLLSALTVISALAALFWGSRDKLLRVLLGLSILTVLLQPVIHSYHPAVSAAPGYDLHVPTAPNWLLAPAKFAGVGAEFRRSDYRLIGWSTDETLYYEERHGGTVRQYIYQPRNEKRSRFWVTIPSNLVMQPERWTGLQHVVDTRVPLVRFFDIVREPGILSPNGQWYAFVARHTYGPEDVIVVSTGE
ncbi:MAG: hypothetical protein U9Q70_09295 [Chloroflexota bacterium]|nr:hypothetical protein [Chloroflexota bacterium]